MKEKDALRIYDLLREAHKSIRQLQLEYPLLESDSENAIDAVDTVLYLAEGFFVEKGRR